MARLNLSVGQADEKSRDDMPVTPKGNLNDSFQQDEEDADRMSARINQASGKKTSPSAPSPPQSIFNYVHTLGKSLNRVHETPSKPADQSNIGQKRSIDIDRAEDEPVGPNPIAATDAHVIENATRSTPETESKAKAMRGLTRPKHIAYDMSKMSKPRRDRAPDDASNDEQPERLQTPRSVRRRDTRSERRGSQGPKKLSQSKAESKNQLEEEEPEKEPEVEELEVEELELEELEEPASRESPQARRGPGRRKKTVNELVEQPPATQKPRQASKRKATEMENEGNEEEISDPQEEPVKRGRGRPRIHAKPVSSSEIQPHYLRKNPKTVDRVTGKESVTAMSGRKPEKKGQVKQTPSAVVPELSNTLRSTRSRTKVAEGAEKTNRHAQESEGQDDDLEHEDSEPSTPQSGNRSTEARENLSHGSPELGGTEEPSNQRTSKREDNPVRSASDSPEASDEPVTDFEDDETEDSAINRPAIRKMQRLMWRVGRRKINGKFKSQELPKCVTDPGKHLNGIIDELIITHKAMGQTLELGAAENITIPTENHHKMKENLEALKKEVENITSTCQKHESGVEELSKKQKRRISKTIRDVYAHSIPKLVDLAEISFNSYSSHGASLGTLELSEISEILGYLQMLCKVTRKAPKQLQPESDVQLLDPTRKLFPIIRQVYDQCWRELERREEAEKDERWKADVPERKRKKQEQDARRAAEKQEKEAVRQRNEQKAAEYRRTQLSQQTQSTQESLTAGSQLVSPKPLSLARKTLAAEKDARKSAELAKKALSAARRSARDANEDPFNEDLVRKADADAEEACRALESAKEAEKKKVYLAYEAGFMPAPFNLRGLAKEPVAFQTVVRVAYKPAQSLGRRAFQTTPPPEQTEQWREEELMLLFNGLEQNTGDDRYTIIAESLPTRDLDEIFARAKEAKEYMLDDWHEKRSVNPRHPPLPDWITSI